MRPSSIPDIFPTLHLMPSFPTCKVKAFLSSVLFIFSPCHAFLFHFPSGGFPSYLIVHSLLISFTSFSTCRVQPFLHPQFFVSSFFFYFFFFNRLTASLRAPLVFHSHYASSTTLAQIDCRLSLTAFISSYYFP